MAIYIKTKADNGQVVVLMSGFNKNSMNKCQNLIDELKNSATVVTIDLSSDKRADEYHALGTELFDPIQEKQRLKTKYEFFRSYSHELMLRLVDFFSQK